MGVGERTGRGVRIEADAGGIGFGVAEGEDGDDTEDNIGELVPIGRGMVL